MESHIEGSLLAERLSPYIANSQTAPPSFAFTLDDWKTSRGMEYAGEILKPNTTISWLTIKFPEDLDETITVDHAADMLHFVANSTSLVALELECDITCGNESVKEIGRAIVAAAARNKCIEMVRLAKWTCNYISDLCSSSSIKEITAFGVPMEAAENWPVLPSSLVTLRLGAPFRDRQNKSISAILEKMRQSEIPQIQNLWMRGWSWSLPYFLREGHSIQNLHFDWADFKHGPDSDGSNMDGLLLGLMGKTTQLISFQDCSFDSNAIARLQGELQSGTLALKALSFHNTALEEPILNLVCCHILEKLELDCDNDTGCVDSNIELVVDQLINGKIPALRIPTLRLNALCTPLKIAATKGALTSLELTKPDWDEETLDWLVHLMKSEDCHLQHLGLLLMAEDDFSKVIKALEGASKLLSLRVDVSSLSEEGLKCAIQKLVESLPDIKSLQTLILGVCDGSEYAFSPELETPLGEGMTRNWSLESVSLFPGGVGAPSYSGSSYLRPILTLAFQAKLNKLMSRNIARKEIMAPNMSEKEGQEIMHAMESYWGLPDGLSLAFWLLQCRSGALF